MRKSDAEALSESPSTLTPITGSRGDGYSDYKSIGSHGYYVLGTVSRYGKLWFVKSLSPKARDITECRRWLAKEYEILLSLKHTGVVRAVGLEELPEAGLSLIMEYVDGVHLDKYLLTATREGRGRVARQLVEAVAYIHSRGLVHLDLKPQNILVGGTAEHPHLCVIDFNLSDGRVFSKDKEVGGNRRYAAPEQFEPGYEAAPSADVWSLGLLLSDIGGGYSWRIAAGKALRVDADKRLRDASEILLTEKRVRVAIRRAVIAGVIILTASVIALMINMFSAERALSPGASPQVNRVDTVMSPALPAETVFVEREVPGELNALNVNGAGSRVPEELRAEYEKCEDMRRKSLKAARSKLASYKKVLLETASDSTYSPQFSAIYLGQVCQHAAGEATRIMRETRGKMPESILALHSAEWCTGQDTELAKDVEALKEYARSLSKKVGK
ncbi:MAG: protein kinase [Bacteroidales bacterium]|nr:protein kinase [Bacteroidales bacterium]